MTQDPFEGISDEAPLGTIGWRQKLLASAKRGFVPIRKTFVQRPRSETVRASILSTMVNQRHERALDAFLLLHALEPAVIRGPMGLDIWASVLSKGNLAYNSAIASKAFDVLVKLNLVQRTSVGRKPIFMPLLEDGSGSAWQRPGTDKATLGPGYFTIPYEYWTDGLVDQLHLPGKAMFLITLAETTQKPTFAMAFERAQAWYGISERTAERGYKELDKAGILLQQRQVVNDRNAPKGIRPVVHRALADPYSMFARTKLQSATARTVRRKLAKAEAGKFTKQALKQTSRKQKVSAKASNGRED